MGYIISISLLYCLVVFLPNISGIRPFWRKTTITPPTPPPTLLPPPAKAPEFYRKLREDIPPKAETAKKVIKNILRIRPGVKGKRQIANVNEDTVIVMDGSGSIGSCEFEKGKKAMKNLVGFVQNGFDAKYGMVTFASNVRRDFGFQPSLVAASKMDGVIFPSGSTNTQAGLEEALKLFTEGGRGISDKYVMLLTDGQSNVRKANTLPNAQKLKDAGVKIFVVAVGGRSISGIDEMAHIATFPPKDYLFRVKKVDDFLQVVNLAIREVDGKYVLDGEFDQPC